MTIRIPELQVKLPATTGRGVQGLEENPTIRVSHPLGAEQETRGPEALRYVITLDLGNVGIRGDLLDVQVTGAKGAPPRIELAETARIAGDIELVKGSLQLLNKRFDIERGLVRLRPEDTANPYVNVTAHWDAPDGSRIFIDYVGTLLPITPDKLKFRSSTSRTQSEILATVLFGDPYAASTASAVTSTTATAAGLGAQHGNQPAVGAGALGAGIDQLTQVFGQALSGLAPLGSIAVRFSAAEDGRLRPTLVYTLGDQVSATATRDLPGFSTGGTANANTTERTQLGVEWRFKPNWSLRGSLGVGGDRTTNSGGLDLLWQYRY
jgi:translocation and assembly module TamB